MDTDPIIVGWGHSRFGKLDEDLERLIAAVTREAIADAEVDPYEIDAIWLGHFNSGLIGDGFCSSMVLGAVPALRFKPATRCENACASGAAAIYSALDAVRSGRVKLALVVGAEKMSGLTTAAVTKALAGASYQAEERDMSFPQIFARFAHAYAEEFDNPAEAMAHISVKNHGNAMRNPLAQMHRPVDLEFCRHVSERNPMIADPLKLSDCSLVSDGAAALVIAQKSMASRFRRAVGFRAAEQVNDLLPLSAKRLALFEGPREAFRRAYTVAGVTVDDLSFAEVHDCFTIAELMTVEAMGLSEPGRASACVIEGQTRRDGRLPINLSGGLKAKGHPVGATGVSMHVLAAKQLVGEAGDMQLEHPPSLGLCFNMGGGAVANCVSILERLR